MTHSIGIIGCNGYVGSYLTSFFNRFESFDVYPIEKKNYKQMTVHEFDIIIDSSNNSKKYISESDYYRDFNESVVNCAKNVENFSAKKYILISSIDIYSSIHDICCTNEDSQLDILRQSKYGFNKFLAELLVKKTCNDWLILRLSGMIGGNLKKGPIYDILNDQPLRLKKTSTIPVLHLEKICNAIKHLIISKKSNEVYNIASNNSISIANIASLMQKTPKYHREAIHRELYIDNSKISKEIDMGSSEDSINLNCEN